jgi:hypothetical protein
VARPFTAGRWAKPPLHALTHDQHDGRPPRSLGLCKEGAAGGRVQGPVSRVCLPWLGLALAVRWMSATALTSASAATKMQTASQPSIQRSHV